MLNIFRILIVLLPSNSDNQFWIQTKHLLSSVCLEMISRFSFYFDFGVEVRLTVLCFLILTFCPFLCKRLCKLLPQFASSVILALIQASVTPISHVWTMTVPCSAHLLLSPFCEPHSHSSQLSVYEWSSPRLFL